MQVPGLIDGACRVVGQQRGHLQRHPAVHGVGAGVDGREQAGGPAQVGQGQVEEHLLVRGSAGHAGGDVGVVGGAVLDRPVEDGGVGGEPGHRVLGDVAGEGSLIEQGAGDVVQAETLAPPRAAPGSGSWLHRGPGAGGSHPPPG